MENDPKAMTTKELTSAVSQLLEREERRVVQQRKKRRRRVHQRREETQASIRQLTHSIEVIKWCIVGIATFLGLALLVMIFVVMQVRSEAGRIKSEVEGIKGQAETMVRQIEEEADKIREKIQNPLRSIGGALGGQLDARIGDALGVEK